jgi:eukaryotic-like serine/threonine-protein kinase
MPAHARDPDAAPRIAAASEPPSPGKKQGREAVLTDDDLPGGAGAATVAVAATPDLAAGRGKVPAPGPAPQKTMTDPAAAARGDNFAGMAPKPRVEEAPLDPEALPRPILERFEDLRFLGRGGMGTVYRARDTQLQREVALKFIHRHDPLAGARILREARAQARVEHEHVCKIHEVSVAEGRPYIVMEYVDGEPLSRMAERLTVEEKVKVIREVAAALHEAHRLGLVHRDVKPSNIMLERAEDGTWKPYVMDFGLAREAGGQGQTMSGNFAGTPAFMAPEQARGELRSLDRRTDVYSLGATLYDLLAGHPPFADAGAVQAVARLLSEEAPPLRGVCPTVPEDLDKIVMKCLEREPQRRYESARAVAEDLQRYLDGEPVLARRASLRYVLRKRAKKHRLLLSVSGALLVAGMVLVGSWIRARRLAAEEARLAHDLGEDVKEMQLFMRYASALPLHDIGREREVVRRRLAEIERKMSAAGRAAEGPGQYALGSGYLALEEPDKALSHLRRASAAGYTSPELSYATGLSLVELYKVAREGLSRIEDQQKRAAREKELDAEYRGPALAHLGAARGTAIESPAYVEGLIALYSGKPEEAVAKAKEAFERAPWLYEAKRLEGDAQAALGRQYDLDAHFDWDRMMAHFGPATEAYRVAAKMAESDPEVHLAECTLWMQIMNATGAKGETQKTSLAKADEACARAIVANPRDGRAAVQRAIAHARCAFAEADEQAPSVDPRTSIEEAIRFAEEAVRGAPEDAMAHIALGQAFVADVLYAINVGHDGDASIQRAEGAIEEAIRIDPRFALAMMQRAQVGSLQITFDTWRGIDVTPAMESALRFAERVITLDPGYAFGWAAKGYVHFFTAAALAERGQSPEEQVGHTMAAAEEVERRSPGWTGAYYLKAWCHRLMALHKIHTGDDPGRSLEQAMQLAEEVKERNPGPYQSVLVGTIRYAEALHLLHQARDPEPALSEAREELRRAAEATPWNAETRVWRARVEIVNLRWSMKQHKAQPAMFEAALAPLLPLASEDLAYPDPYQTMAEIYALRAAWRFEDKMGPVDDVKRGLSMADKALSKNPHMATAYATKGAIYLISARRARDEGARRDAAGRAKEALAAAFKENPLLEREHASAREEAERLLGDDPSRSP